MGLAAELQKLGGFRLLRAFVDSFELEEDDIIKVKTDRGVEAELTVSRLRKVLSGNPWLHAPGLGQVGKKEAAKVLLKKLAPPRPRFPRELPPTQA